jgi:hypothetical protein
MKLSPAKIQLALAVIGIPLIIAIWSPEAKWPNPLRQPAAKPRSQNDPPAA